METISKQLAAELEGISIQWLREKINKGKFKTICTRKQSSNQWDVFEVLVNSLSPAAQEKYYQRKQAESSRIIDFPGRKIEDKPETSGFEALPEYSKKEVFKRLAVINEAEELVERAEKLKDLTGDKFSKTKIMKRIAEKHKVDYRSLYRWQRKYNRNNRNIMSLVPGWGALSSRPESIGKEAWEYFLSHYLTPKQLAFSKVYRMTKNKFQGTPSESAYRLRYRKFERENYDLVIYMREGEKAYKDKCEFLMLRSKDNIKAMSIWVGDEHTLDIRVRIGNEIRRPIMTAWQDIKSNKITGWVLAEYGNTITIASSLRKGFGKYGLPDNLYMDNGKDYKSKFLTDEVKGFLTMLGINPDNQIFATYYNARAKQIERAFRELCRNCSKSFANYLGSNPVQRPPDQAKIEKKGLIVTLDEAKNIVEKYIKWYNNQPSQGEGMNGRTPDEVFKAEYRQPVKRVDPKDLTFLMMQDEGIRQVRNGIVTLNNIPYRASQEYNGNQVLIKRDPEDMDNIALLTPDKGEFLMIAKPYKKHRYFGDKERLSKAMQKRYRRLRQIKEQAFLISKGRINNPEPIDEEVAYENLDVAAMSDTTVDDIDSRSTEIIGTGIAAARAEYEKKREKQKKDRIEIEKEIDESGIGGMFDNIKDDDEEVTREMIEDAISMCIG